MAQKRKRTVKVGVVGCGVVATAYYLPYLMKMEQVEVVAVCDIYPARTDACIRLFGAKKGYQDYDQMIKQADIEAVFILTGPGTHVPFALTAIEAGKHILVQKPMATNMDGARAVYNAVRESGVVALIEPSSNSPLDPNFRQLRGLVKKGVLGDPYWFSYATTGPTTYHPSLNSNPYGAGAFFTKDSGGFLFDFPYAPNKIVSVLGACKSVMAQAKISVPHHHIVPDSHYNDFLSQATDPDKANYWDVVLDLPRTQPVQMEAPDNVYSLYEMADGTIGACHVGRIFHPVLSGSGSGDLQIFGTEGNLLFGSGYIASIITNKKDLLPAVEEDGWFHLRSQVERGKAKWPQPTPGAFNYYHRSSQHFIDCILEGQEPIVGVDWGLHITEMMAGALESSKTGQRYEMTTTLDY